MRGNAKALPGVSPGKTAGHRLSRTCPVVPEGSGTAIQVGHNRLG